MNHQIYLKYWHHVDVHNCASYFWTRPVPYYTWNRVLWRHSDISDDVKQYFWRFSVFSSTFSHLMFVLTVDRSLPGKILNVIKCLLFLARFIKVTSFLVVQKCFTMTKLFLSCSNCYFSDVITIPCWYVFQIQTLALLKGKSDIQNAVVNFWMW